LKEAPANAAAGCCAGTGPTVSEAAGEKRSAGAVEPAAGPPPLPGALDLGAEGLAVGKAYQDVFRVLKDDSSCSRFFGGPRAALTVFNEFARRLRGKPLGQSYVALRMSGDYTTYHDQRADVWYRIFDEATVNSEGPFSPHFEPPRGWRSRVGRFPVETRAAKALMLLHELGHLIKGPDGRWLLPNDGRDAALSGRNTREVQSRCMWQLLKLQV
jgi:hypothetical protein